jgi:MFS family permease
VTFQLCFLTFAVYVGSSIYTAGIPDLVEDFHVSQVVATIGLTVFVLGYGLGKTHPRETIGPSAMPSLVKVRPCLLHWVTRLCNAN